MPTTILIAEDDADIREVLRLYLEGEGFAVAEAEDGRSWPWPPNPTPPSWT